MTEDRLLYHMKLITNAFIEAKITRMCIYSSALLIERLNFEGINSKLVVGYLQTQTQEHEEFCRHVWVESNGFIYDSMVNVLKEIWKDSAFKYQHFHTLPPVPIIASDKELEYGINL